jgi:hypothetical protein
VRDERRTGGYGPPSRSTPPPDPGSDDPAVTGVPERGDAVEIPGEPLALEYEQVRSAPPWLTPLVISVITLFAVFVVTRATILDEEDTIGLSAVPEGAVPDQLADGTVPPGLPDAVTGRFDAPVVGTLELSEAPATIADRCQAPFDAEQLDAAALERIDEVIREGAITDLRMGPEVVSVLRTGRAESPPRFPDVWALSCLGRYEDGQWVARAPRLDFARDGAGGAADAGPGVTARLVQVPAAATWAVQERDGWWLASAVDPGSWAQLIVEGTRTGSDVRVVFLDDDGTLVEDRRLALPATGVAAELAQGAGGEVEIGPVQEVLAAVEEAPVRGCATAEPVCVWVTQVGSELVAHAAYGPHQLDVPPFGEVGWCPAAERFQGTVTRSQFAVDGAWRSGIAPRGSTGFGLRFDSGVVVVDLGDVRLGEPATGEPEPAPLCVFTGEPVGGEPEDPAAVTPL